MSTEFSYKKLFSFTGGLNTKSPQTALKEDEAADLDNITVLLHGGFVSRYGNSLFNASAMNSGASVHGISYFKTSANVEYICSVSGDKIYKSDALDGTMDDITGAATITAGNDSLWSFSNFSNLLIGVGGPISGAADTPLKWSGTGNVAALGGSPPAGKFCISANRRLFIGNTATNPSRIQWSVLGNPDDWSGAGSGSQDVMENDGDDLVGGAQLNQDHLILFKQGTIHDLVVTTAPFPVFQLFKGVGAVSKNAIVAAEGKIYFMTLEPRMKATDGTSIFSFPDSIDPILDSLNASRLKYIQGIYYPRLRQIWWICSYGTATTNNYCIVWDLSRECWLKNTTGYKMNCVCLAANKSAYAGNYAGQLFKLDDSSKLVDDSEPSDARINAYWRSGWIDLGSGIVSKQTPVAEVLYSRQSSGTFDFGWGFDFLTDQGLKTISSTTNNGTYTSGILGSSTWGIQSVLTNRIDLKGHGKYFQFLVNNKDLGSKIQFNGVELKTKQSEESVIK